MEREALLEKEAKYEHGLKKNDYDYDELLNSIRENNNTSRQNDRIGMWDILYTQVLYSFYFRS